MTHRRSFALLLALGITVAGCGDSTPTPSPDAAQADVPTDSATDATSDASANDASIDATSDASNDVTSDVASDASSDVTSDVASDASNDVTSDVASDVSSDSEATDVISVDATTDASAFDVSADASVDASFDAPAMDAVADASVDVAPVDVTAPDAAALCSSIPANTAPVIMDTYTTAPMPSLSSLTGGTILPGLYFETAHIYHGAASGAVHTWQATSEFDATATTATLNSNRDGAPFQQWAERLSVMGQSLTITIACPPPLAGSSLTVGFNYAAGELHVFTYSDNTETVFTRQ